MSIQIMSQVWNGFPGNGSRLLALLSLADHANDDGLCWPSMNSIANKIRLSRSQAQRVVHGLIEDGYLVVVGNHAGGVPGASRRYRIVTEALTGRADTTGSANATGRIHAQKASHGCAITGSTHATQIINEPSVTIKKESARKASRLPSDWKPDEVILKWTMDSFGWTHEQTTEITEKFVDYWLSAAGSKGVKQDWNATWRNWCRNEAPKKTCKPVAAKADFTHTDYTKGF